MFSSRYQARSSLEETPVPHTSTRYITSLARPYFRVSRRPRCAIGKSSSLAARAPTPNARTIATLPATTPTTSALGCKSSRKSGTSPRSATSVLATTGRPCKRHRLVVGGLIVMWHRSQVREHTLISTCPLPRGGFFFVADPSSFFRSAPTLIEGALAGHVRVWPQGVERRRF